MGRKLGPRAIAGAVLAACTLIVAGAVPANAVVNRTYDIETVEAGNGSAHAWGDLTWYDASTFYISGRVNDRCPADGYGAYLDGVIVFKDGDAVGVNIAADTGGCDDPDGVAFSKGYDRTRRIDYVILQVCEFDKNTGQSRDCESRWKDNPYTS